MTTEDNTQGILCVHASSPSYIVILFVYVLPLFLVLHAECTTELIFPWEFPSLMALLCKHHLKTTQVATGINYIIWKPAEIPKFLLELGISGDYEIDCHH